jgi:hypothetical protein
VVHFPIAGLFLLLVLEAGALALRREGWHRAGLVLLIGTLVAFLGAIVTGFIRESWLQVDAAVARLVEIHRLTMFSSADVLLAVWLIGGPRAFGPLGLPRPARGRGRARRRGGRLWGARRVRARLPVLTNG